MRMVLAYLFVLMLLYFLLVGQSENGPGLPFCLDVTVFLIGRPQ